MIELILVMIIIGILAAISVPRFTQIVRQSEAASEQGVLVNLVAALDVLCTSVSESKSESSVMFKKNLNILC